MLSEIYWSFFTTSVISFLIIIIRFGYKSKCRSCKLGCCEIIRDTENEEKIDELQLQTHGTTSKDEKENSV